jgi:hypothetical protein
MSTKLLRTSVLGLSVALAACGSSTSPAPVRTNSAIASPASQPSRIRVWRSDDGTTRTVVLTISKDGSADLFIRGPAESVPHWGELKYPERLEHASLERVGDRTFLLFFDGNYPAEVAEITDRPGDRLAIWFHCCLVETDVISQLSKLPRGVPPTALVLIPQVLPDRRDKPASSPTPATRFST